jgi:putative glutamine amidotransferase
MTPADSQPSIANRPRVGIPWRMTGEKRSKKLEYYFEAVRKAGAEAEEISLQLSPEQLEDKLNGLDAFVLPGSPADLDPGLYHATRGEKTHDADPNREKTDFAILDHAFASGKPVLAICYGCQSLNVHLQGTLIQDIRTKNPEALTHGHTDLPPGEWKGDDQKHDATLAPGSLLAKLVGSTSAHINSSHHQAIDRPGEKLRVTANAPDGTIEGVEWTGDSNWVVGVQWHPERMPPEDTFSRRLFEEFVAAAQARDAVAHKA